MLERFSLGYRKLIDFILVRYRIGLKKLAPLSGTIRSKTKTNRNSLAQVFMPFASASCICYKFLFIHSIYCVLCDWPEQLLSFWFYDTQFKAALFSCTDDENRALNEAEWFSSCGPTWRVAILGDVWTAEAAPILSLSTGRIRTALSRHCSWEEPRQEEQRFTSRQSSRTRHRFVEENLRAHFLEFVPK